MLGLELAVGPAIITFVLFVTTLLLVYKFTTRNYDYWEKRGVPFVKPLPIIGSVYDTIKTPLHEVELKRYKELGNVYGHYEGNKILLSVGDPTILRDILVKEFQSFTGRRIFTANDPIVDKMLSVVRGEDWKRIRSIVTPTFSTGKIKRMMSIFKDCGNTLVKNFKAAAEQGKSVDAKRIYGAFTMDIIASSAFSTKIDSHNDPDNQFVAHAKNVFNQKLGLKFVLFLSAPWIVRLLRIKIFASEASEFFKSVTLQIIEERKRTGQVRNDFLQLLMDTAKEVAEENKWEEVGDIASNYGQDEAAQQIFKTTTSKNLSLDELVAQCVIFFLAGYDTTASTLSFVSYNLAIHPEIQDRLREEVDRAIKDNDGKLTYEAVQKMQYMDNVISESMRLYTPVIRLERLCDNDIELGDTGITVKKGQVVTIPTYAMHRDPALFPEPEKFDPDRFTAEERSKRDPYSFLPFGAGPRNCVAMRFALMEVKVCLALVIANFKIKRCQETKVPLDFHLGQQGLLQPKEILLGLEVRTDSPITE